MVLKDWRVTKIDFQNVWYFYNNKSLPIKLRISSPSKHYDAVFAIEEDIGFGGRILSQKYFKTKQEALNKAKQYMKTH